MKKTLMTTTALCLALGVAFATPVRADEAYEAGTLDYYKLSMDEIRNDQVAWKLYVASQYREPCQNYIVPPEGYLLKGCDVYRLGVKEPVVETTQTTTTTQTQQLLPIVSSYTIYFDFDKSGVRQSEQATLDRVANEIKQYNPEQITVAGHADRSGDAGYNQILSQKRAQAVSAALTADGIANEVIDKEAYGETDNAVPTPDGVKNQENRRVVIDFRRAAQQ
jgi:outer membrane protein OmpA-like peptidoglycan-associated protein